MNQFTKALLLTAMVSMAHAGDDDDIGVHFDAPLEEDVPIVAIPCFANDNGFGGAITDTSFTVEYYYEMVYRFGGDEPDALLSSFERDTTNFLLQSDLFVSPCSEVVPRQAGNAQGISANPPDEDLDGIQCSTLTGVASRGTACVVVNGAFEVFYIDDGNGENGLKQRFETKIKNGINNGDFTISHQDIVEVAAVPDPTGTPGGKDPAKTPDSNIVNPNPESDNTGIIIGGVVGAVVVVGAAALYQSRRAGSAASSAAGAASSAASAGADV